MITKRFSSVPSGKPDARPLLSFLRTVRASFAMRRKKLSNGLASGFPELGKAGAEEVIAACGLDVNVRGETLDIAQFAAIANEICARRG